MRKKNKQQGIRMSWQYITIYFPCKKIWHILPDSKRETKGETVCRCSTVPKGCKRGRKRYCWLAATCISHYALIVISKDTSFCTLRVLPIIQKKKHHHKVLMEKTLIQPINTAWFSSSNQSILYHSYLIFPELNYAWEVKAEEKPSLRWSQNYFFQCIYWCERKNT